MPLFVGDYLGDTTHLTQGQHGAYLLLIMHYWQRESLPSNQEQCYCIAHAMDEQTRCNADAVLRHFFRKEGDRYWHKRIDIQLEKAKSSYERRASAANSRWKKEKEGKVDLSNADAKYEQSYSNPSDSDSSSVVDVDSNPEFEAEIRQIAALHPKITDAFHLPGYIGIEIGNAIARHGYPVVWAGTKALGDAVAQWPPGERRYVAEAVKFYKESTYLTDPEIWRNGNGKQAKPSTSAARSERSKTNIVDGIGKDISRRDALVLPQLKVGAGK